MDITQNLINQTAQIEYQKNVYIKSVLNLLEASVAENPQLLEEYRFARQFATDYHKTMQDDTMSLDNLLIISYAMENPQNAEKVKELFYFLKSHEKMDLLTHKKFGYSRDFQQEKTLNPTTVARLYGRLRAERKKTPTYQPDILKKYDFLPEALSQDKNWEKGAVTEVKNFLKGNYSKRSGYKDYDR